MEPNEILKDTLNTLEHGWNNANGQEFSKPFADNSEFVDITGTLHQHATPEYVANAHQGLFASIYKDSKIAYEPIQAMCIDQNTIVANAKAELDAPSGPLSGKNGSTITLVLIKSDDDWKIRAFQNTLVMKR